MLPARGKGDLSAEAASAELIELLVVGSGTAAFERRSAELDVHLADCDDAYEPFTVDSADPHQRQLMMVSCHP